MSSTQPLLKFSDTGDERLYFRKYCALPTRDASTFRVIDHNNKDYFTVINEDADLIADSVYKTSSVVKTSAAQKYRYVTISPQVFTNTVLRLLLIDRNMRVEIYSHKTFELLVQATPANYERLSAEYGVNLDAMQPSYTSPIVASIKLSTVAGGVKKFGCCFVDVLGKKMHVTEFVDNEVFLNLESLILQVGIKEVVMVGSGAGAAGASADSGPVDVELAKIVQVLDKTDVVVTFVKNSIFNGKDIEQDLGKLIEMKENQNIELVLGSRGINSVEYGQSLACCAALILYLELLQDGEAQGSYTIDKYDLGAYMKLDSSTVKALNVFASAGSASGAGPGNANTGSASTISSIFELLNKCKTAAGSRLLSQWLKQPLTSHVAITERQLLVQQLIDDTSLRVYITKDFLPQVPDVKRLVKKINMGIKRASSNENKKLEDVVRLYQLVVALPELVSVLKLTVEEETTASDSSSSSSALIKEYWLSPIEQFYESLVKLQELVETTVDLSPLSNGLSSLFNDFNIKPEFDESLITINDKLTATVDKIKECHSEVGDDLCIDTEKKLKLENHAQHGWCFRVTRGDSAILRNSSLSLKKYIELQTVKAGIFFTTKELRTLSQQYQDFSSEYNSKQKELIKEILVITLTYQNVLNQLAMVLAHMDVLAGFAHAAIFAAIPYVKPILHPLAASDDKSGPEFEARKLKLDAARHPILEVQDDINFIANDVRLGRNSEEKPFNIITGPNMGGKSTYIRQIGVISLMAQVGSFVPVDELSEPELPIFDAILSRIGAGDLQLKGLSTFMIEMLETSSILSTATHNSLIIIDELGRGTSTYDGFGLAWSILEHLITEMQCFTLFATHFHELTQLAAKYTNQVENLHVVAHVEEGAEAASNDDDITLMYRVEPGISDKSFGIHVAELVKFPQKIVNMAKRKVSELESTTDDSIIENKKSKCSAEEVATGVDQLKAILKKWRLMAAGKSADDAVEVLRKLVLEEYKDTIKEDKFISEVLGML